MAIDQNVTPPAPETRHVSAIENEIPAYRAINPAAVLSLVFSVLGLLSFTSWFFLIFSITGLALGIYADRRIRREPEIWTGRGMAQAGTALGLAFGLAAVTTTLVQDFLRGQQVTRFAQSYVNVLNKGSMEDAVWYTFPPGQRETKDSVTLYNEFKKSAPDPHSEEMQMGGVQTIKKAITSRPGTEAHLSKIEAHGVEGLNYSAAARLEIHTHGSGKEPEKEEFALLLLRAAPINGRYRWWIESAKYPYTPSSYVPEVRPVDDGHGHGHH